MLTHKNPLRLQNAILATIFSLDVTRNLRAYNSSKGENFIVRDGAPESKYYKSADSALKDLAGLGFDLGLLLRKGIPKSKII